MRSPGKRKDKAADVVEKLQIVKLKNAEIVINGISETLDTLLSKGEVVKAFIPITTSIWCTVYRTNLLL